MTDTLTDEQLAAAVQSGDRDIYGELVNRYRAKLARYARRFLLDADDAQDIVQDVFIKAYRHIDSFDTARRFSPWIYRIAHNEFINALKKRSGRRRALELDSDAVVPQLEAPDTADSAALARDLRHSLDRHLCALDPKYREPLILYYLEDMSYKEVADIMQIPTSTVGVRLARARALLRGLAADDAIGETPG